MSKYLDKTYVINMDKDVDRLNDFDHLMKSCQWDYTRISAVNGKELDKSNEWVSKYIKGKMTKSEMGCFLSHIMVWLEALKQDYQRIAVFEDDTVTSSPGHDILESINNFYQYLSEHNIEEPDILYLGKCLSKCSKFEKIYSNVYKTDSLLCTHSYIITKKGMEKILLHSPFDKALDIVLKKLMKVKTISVATFHPSLFFQNVITASSNLRSSMLSFQNTCECEEVHNYLYNVYIPLLAVAIFLLLTLLTWYLVEKFYLQPKKTRV